MTLYLIAHKVRGEPAFDVATKLECPECHGYGVKPSTMDTDMVCTACDAVGDWWIIPTSGHRAYPYWHADLNEILSAGGPCDALTHGWLGEMFRNPPVDLPDHYAITAPSRSERPSAVPNLEDI